MNSRRDELPVWETTIEAWRHLAANLARVPAVGLFPALLFLALIRLKTQLDLEGWAMLVFGLPYLALHAIPATLIVVPWYRAALLPPGQAAAGPIPAWYYLRLLPRWLLLEMIIFVPLMPVEAIGIAYDIGKDAADPRNASYLLLTIMVIGAAAWPYARSSVALPAAALGADARFAQAWRLSVGNGWRIVGAMLLCSAPLIFSAIVVRRWFPQEPAPDLDFVLSCLGAVYYLFTELLGASLLAQVYLRLGGARPIQ